LHKRGEPLTPGGRLPAAPTTLSIDPLLDPARRVRVAALVAALIAASLGVTATATAQQPASQPAAPQPQSPPPADQPAEPPADQPATEAQSATPATEPQTERQAPGRPPSSAPTLRKETVTAPKLTDTEERRYSTATKIVFGREELDRYGDTNLTDVLKRLPGITISGAPGRGGDIRMRGLGRGYTLILLNGESMPRGFSLDTLSPDQVERIEILRAPIAENSARAIAGTINIVLREEIVRRDNEIRPSLGLAKGDSHAYVTAQRSNAIDKFSYNLTATAGHSDTERDSRTETRAIDPATQAPLLLQDQQDRVNIKSDNLNFNARLNWQLDGGNVFTLTPFLNASRRWTTLTSQLEQPLGAIPAPYATSHTDSSTDITVGRLFGNWRLRLPDNARLELRFNTGKSVSSVESDTEQRDAAGGIAHVLRNTTRIHDTSLGTGGKYSRPVAAGHQLGAGWDLEASRRDERASDVHDGVDPLAQYGDIEVITERAALYVQDEWNITSLWAMYGGLRWETIRTRSESAIDAAKNRSSVLSPLFQTVWRFDPDSKDQIRLAVTRTYRPPTLSDLVAVPTLSQLYPPSGPNTPTNADSVGNPDLKPELAWGVDVAFEHYFEAGGVVSVNMFRRSIDDLIRNVKMLESVPWSPVPRWVSRPRNIGEAQSHGIELEAKFRLDELIDDAPRVNFRTNYSRFWSKVDDIPGPDNRIDQQPPWTANFGADYRLTSLPLTLGGNINFTPGFAVQQSVTQQYRQSRKRAADVYALWRIDASLQLRLSVSNLFADDYETRTREVFEGVDQTATTLARTYRFYGARLEFKF
jgi:iron complex outermembrane receptor protein